MAKGKLSKKNILHLAKLSSLQVSEKEVEKYEGQFGETLKFMGNLNELKTENVESTNHVTQLKDVFFEDGMENKRGLSKEEVMKNSKSKKDGMFVVKRLIQ